MIKIQREEYCRDSFDVAKNVILGAVLYTNLEAGLTGGIITEVEVYPGGCDKGSHSYENKRTKRTEIQFGFGGYAYVFLVYGIHCQFCIVTNLNDKPEVVLIRAIEPVTGKDIMMERRGITDMKRLTVGPGNVSKALGISLTDYGEDLTGNRIFLCKNVDKRRREKLIAETPRIGIDYAEEYKDMPWRYYLERSRFVSKA